MSSSEVYGITRGGPVFHPAVGTVGCTEQGQVCSSKVAVFGRPTNRSIPRRGRCTGTLIAPRVVLTAAHCFQFDNSNELDDRGIFHIYEDDYSIPYEPGVWWIKEMTSISGDVLAHPKHRSNDIALLILDEPAPVPPLPISLNNMLPIEGDELSLYGYGTTGFNCEEDSQGLRNLSLPITEIDNSIRLRDEMEDISESDPNTTVSAPIKLGMCPGDSGGPALDDQGEIVGVFYYLIKPVDMIDGNEISRYHETFLVPIADHLQWILRYTSFSLVNKKSNKCLEIAASNSPQEIGLNIRQWNCHVNDNNQLYYFHYIWDGSFMIRSLYSGMCLGVKKNQSDNWVSIKQYPCTGDLWQRWEKVYDENGWFQITSKYSNKCLNIINGSEKNGADVILYSCHNDSNMWWRETFPVKLNLSSSNKCIEVGGWNINEGANINIWDCIENSNQTNQIWGIETFDQPGICFITKEACKIRSLNSGQCATAVWQYSFPYGLSLNLQQEKCSGYSDEESQHWFFEPLKLSNEDIPIHFQLANYGSYTVPPTLTGYCISVKNGEHYNNDNNYVTDCRSAVSWEAIIPNLNTRYYPLSIDSDNDGTDDNNDQCPDDPRKISPGSCGCGEADLDTDSDGSMDCIDADDDNDGYSDLEDAFPYDNNEWADKDGDGTGDNGDDDDDGDGITDSIEKNGPNNGDGNDDGVADSLQDNVASFHTFDDQNYVTMESPVGTSISNCKAVDNPSTTNSPSSKKFPYGFFEFTITGVGDGGETTVTLHFPVGKTIDTYYKHGPTPGNDIDHWYEFLNDGESGAEIYGNTVTLHFVDGKRGDDDLTANGIVIDIGGPVVSSNIGGTGGDGTSGGGGGCFIATAVNSSIIAADANILSEFYDHFLLISAFLGKSGLSN